MSLEEAIKEGLRTTRLIGYLLGMVTITVFFIFWFLIGPKAIDYFETVALAYVLGCFFGVMVGRDNVRGYFEEFLQSSEKTQEAEA